MLNKQANKKRENSMRVNLVTRFKCAECGNQLSLCYNNDAKQTQDDYDESDKITGACKVENDIYIEPCKYCVEKPKKDLETLRSLLKG